MNIAEPYCNWIPDEGAKGAPVLVLQRTTGMIAICAFITMPLLGILKKIFPSIDVKMLLPAAFFTFFISAIAHSITKEKASTSLIRCSGCGRHMKCAQHNYPAKANASLHAGCTLIEGADGRQYILLGGGPESSPCWYRVLQELKFCDKCMRYVVVQEKKLVRISEREEDVYECEEKMQRQNRAVTGKKFRIKGK